MSILAEANDLLGALDRDQFAPCFQPIVELRTGDLTGFEVLARWRHPELGLILPQNFISLAESNGLIGQLTHQILRKAFDALPLLPEPLTLAINFSPLQLQDLTLPQQLLEIAAETGFPLSRLHVEITESALVDNMERAQTITRELKAIGCKLVLDDFGTGYSSLLHLQAMPFDMLKVDRSFVSSMTTKRESRKIVAAVVGLGLSLGLNTVAEGVETEEQADMLMLLGCEIGQGWLYGKPLPEAAIPEMIENAADSIPARLLDSRESIVVSLQAHPAQRLSQLQAIYDGAPVCLCFLDRNLRYVSINRRFADMNGASVAAHIGRTIKEMIPEVYPHVLPYLQRALLGEAVVDFEIARPSRIPGRPDVIALMTYQPALDEVGEVIGISVSAIDITDRKHHDAQLHHTVAPRPHIAELN